MKEKNKTTIIIDLDDDVVQALGRLCARDDRLPADIITEALAQEVRKHGTVAGGAAVPVGNAEKNNDGSTVRPYSDTGLSKKTKD